MPKLHLDTDLGGDIDDLRALALEWPRHDGARWTIIFSSDRRGGWSARGCAHDAKRGGEEAYRIGVIPYNRGGGETVNEISNVRMDKAAFSVASLADDSDERDYWLGKSPRERLETVERPATCDPNTARLQRVFAVSEEP
jgi:hypothetical protein